MLEFSLGSGTFADEVEVDAAFVSFAEFGGRDLSAKDLVSSIVKAANRRIRRKEKSKSSDSIEIDPDSESSYSERNIDREVEAARRHAKLESSSSSHSVASSITAAATAAAAAVDELTVKVGESRKSSDASSALSSPIGTTPPSPHSPSSPSPVFTPVFSPPVAAAAAAAPAAAPAAHPPSALHPPPVVAPNVAGSGSGSGSSLKDAVRRAPAQAGVRTPILAAWHRHGDGNDDGGGGGGGGTVNPAYDDAALERPHGATNGVLGVAAAKGTAGGGGGVAAVRTAGSEGVIGGTGTASNARCCRDASDRGKSRDDGGDGDGGDGGDNDSNANTNHRSADMNHAGGTESELQHDTTNHSASGPQAAPPERDGAGVAVRGSRGSLTRSGAALRDSLHRVEDWRVADTSDDMLASLTATLDRKMRALAAGRTGGQSRSLDDDAAVTGSSGGGGGGGGGGYASAVRRSAETLYRRDATRRHTLAGVTDLRGLSLLAAAAAAGGSSPSLLGRTDAPARTGTTATVVPLSAVWGGATRSMAVAPLRDGVDDDGEDSRQEDGGWARRG